LNVLKPVPSLANAIENLSKIEPKIRSLEEIWDGEELNRVRTIQAQKKANDLEVCKRCISTDTYEWFKI